MQEFLIGLLVLVIGVSGYLFLMQAGRVLNYRQTLAEMKADFERLEAEVRGKCSAEGELAFSSGMPITSNPYIPENTDKPYDKFAGYWAFGYALAAEKAAAGV